MLPPNILQSFLESVNFEKQSQLLETFNDKAKFIDEINEIHKASFLNLLKDLTKNDAEKEFNMETTIGNAFLRLDNDISTEALRWSYTHKFRKNRFFFHLLFL